jgi:replication factor C large subunit
MKSSIFPIVVTGSNIFDKKFAPIKKASILVEFAALSHNNILTVLKKTCVAEKLEVSSDSLKAISRHANGDLRAALNDLFTFVIVANSAVDDLAIRKKTVDITQALIPVFKSTDPNVVFGSFDNVAEDLDKIFLWVDHNLPSEYTKSKDLHNAYEVLSLADRFFGRIRKWQYYRYYVYCYLLLSVGIALSKDKKYTSAPNYSQPSRLLKYWQKNMQYAKRKAIVAKLASATNISKKTALQDSLPLLLPVLINNKKIQEELEITDDEIVWLKKISADSF